MRKIGIDVRMASHAGIGRYIRELIRGFGVQKTDDFHGTLLGSKSTRMIFSSTAMPGFNFDIANSPIYSLREQWEMGLHAKRFDLFHVPHFNVPLLCRARLVVTVHDLIYLHEKGATRSLIGKTYVRTLLKKIVRSADAILTVSEYTKTDLLSLFPKFRPSRIFVTHEAASEIFRPLPDRAIARQIRDRYGLEKPYVLFVGSLKSHKNIPALLKAMKIFRNRCKIDAELVCLYNECEVFVLPSFCEGFGLPVLEAMSCGAPVIVSDRASLPEIAGKRVFCLILKNPKRWQIA